MLEGLHNSSDSELRFKKRREKSEHLTTRGLWPGTATIRGSPGATALLRWGLPRHLHGACVLPRCATGALRTQSCQGLPGLCRCCRQAHASRSVQGPAPRPPVCPAMSFPGPRHSWGADSPNSIARVHSHTCSEALQGKKSILPVSAAPPRTQRLKNACPVHQAKGKEDVQNHSHPVSSAELLPAVVSRSTWTAINLGKPTRTSL